MLASCLRCRLLLASSARNEEAFDNNKVLSLPLNPPESSQDAAIDGAFGCCLEDLAGKSDKRVATEGCRRSCRRFLRGHFGGGVGGRGAVVEVDAVAGRCCILAVVLFELSVLPLRLRLPLLLRELLFSVDGETSLEATEFDRDIAIVSGGGGEMQLCALPLRV